MSPRFLSVEDRFWAKVEKPEGDDACWLWVGAVKNGAKEKYGYFKLDGRVVKAHRVAYELHYGVKLTSTQLLLHACDNPSCVRPTHLSLGSPRQNAREMIVRGRRPLKLDPDKVRIIRGRLAVGFKARELAEEFGVHVSAIYKISCGASWSYVE